MLFKFKSKAAGDLIMLEPNGRRVLQIIGKDPGPKGIILPQEMPAAIRALEDAIAKEDAEQRAAEVRRRFASAARASLHRHAAALREGRQRDRLGGVRPSSLADSRRNE
jgi:hypothetical protein